MASQIISEDAILLRGQARVLRMAAAGVPADETLAELLTLIESREPGMRCGLLQVSDQGAHFAAGAGPSLPRSYHDHMATVRITPPYLGPCPEAAHSGTPVMVPDVGAETRYSATWRALVEANGVAALRSTPVVGRDGRVLASLAMYHARPRDPDPSDPSLVGTAADLASVVLQRARDDEAARRRQATLRESEAEFRALAENLPNPCWIADGGGWAYWVNRSWSDCTGIAPDAAEGCDWSALAHPDVLADLTRRWTGCVAAGLPFEMTFPVKGADGAFRPFLTRVSPVRDESGAIVRWVGTSSDVSRVRRPASAAREIAVLRERLADQSAHRRAKEFELALARRARAGGDAPPSRLAAARPDQDAGPAAAMMSFAASNSAGSTTAPDAAAFSST